MFIRAYQTLITEIPIHVLESLFSLAISFNHTYHMSFCSECGGMVFKLKVRCKKCRLIRINLIRFIVFCIFLFKMFWIGLLSVEATMPQWLFDIWNTRLVWVETRHIFLAMMIFDSHNNRVLLQRIYFIFLVLIYNVKMIEVEALVFIITLQINLPGKILFSMIYYKRLLSPVVTYLWTDHFHFIGTKKQEFQRSSLRVIQRNHMFVSLSLHRNGTRLFRPRSISNSIAQVSWIQYSPTCSSECQP